jgi:hypothetical protein
MCRFVQVYKILTFFTPFLTCFGFYKGKKVLIFCAKYTKIAVLNKNLFSTNLKNVLTLYIYYAKMYRLGTAKKREVALNPLTAMGLGGNFRGACPIHTGSKMRCCERLQHKR